MHTVKQSSYKTLTFESRVDAKLSDSDILRNLSCSHLPNYFCWIMLHETGLFRFWTSNGKCVRDVHQHALQKHTLPYSAACASKQIASCWNPGMKATSQPKQ